VEDDDTLRRVMHAQLAKDGYYAASAPDVPAALQILERVRQNLVIADLNLPGGSGVDLLRRIHSDFPGTTVIVMTAFGTIQSAVEAMKAGAYDYVVKPIYAYQLKALVNRALGHQDPVADAQGSPEFQEIVGASSSLSEALDVVRRAASTDATILIHGETGTGKELIAKAIHLRSARRDRPFLTINCAAIPRELLESELFGYVKGSFTGALGHKKGKVEMAEGGTLLLDEIGEMPLDVQVRIMRLLESKEIEKIGAAGPSKVDVRIIAATHRDLAEMVIQGQFREDLYYRLLVVPIEVPPLRERIGDIPKLVHHFFELLKQKHHRSQLRFSQNLLPYFSDYNWPGNVRQLEHLLERIVILSRGDEVTPEDLPELLRAKKAHEATVRVDLPEEKIDLGIVERDLIVRALMKFSGNQTNAARYLGLSRRTLAYRMKKHRLALSIDDLKKGA